MLKHRNITKALENDDKRRVAENKCVVCVRVHVRARPCLHKLIDSVYPISCIDNRRTYETIQEEHERVVRTVEQQMAKLKG